MALAARIAGGIDAEFLGDGLQRVARLHDVPRLQRRFLSVGDDDAERQQEEHRQPGGDDLPAETRRGPPPDVTHDMVRPRRMRRAPGVQMRRRAPAKPRRAGPGQQRPPRGAAVDDAEPVGANLGTEDAGIDPALENPCHIDGGQPVGGGIERVRRADRGDRVGCVETSILAVNDPFRRPRLPLNRTRGGQWRGCTYTVSR